MAATKKDVDDFKVVIDEIMRLSDLLNESHELYIADFDNKFDVMFATINIPKDIYVMDKEQKAFQIHLSSLAQKKLHEIASRQINQNAIKYDITLNEYITDIKNSLYIHIKNGKEFDLSGCSSLLSMAYKRAMKKMKQISYFFPLYAEGIEQGKDIKIGVTRIMHKDNIYPKIEERDRLKTFINDEDTSGYNCFLCIDIPKCSYKSSNNRSKNVADFVFGIIKVFSVSYQINTNHMALKKNPIESNVSHHIECANGKYYVCGSIAYRQNLEVLWSALSDDLNSGLGMIIDKLTEHSVSPKNSNCLSDRLIDSFCWFGDASRDNNEHSQIVKLVTAMERLVTLSIEKKDSGLAKRFSDRISSSIALFHGEINKWRLEAKQIYDLRSDLVHGSQSLYKSYEVSLNFYPFRLACFTILSSCVNFDQVGLNSINYEIALQNMYNQTIKHCLNEKYQNPIP